MYPAGSHLGDGRLVMPQKNAAQVVMEVLQRAQSSSISRLPGGVGVVIPLAVRRTNAAIRVDSDGCYAPSCDSVSLLLPQV